MYMNSLSFIREGHKGQYQILGLRMHLGVHVIESANLGSLGATH